MEDSEILIVHSTGVVLDSHSSLYGVLLDSQNRFYECIRKSS